MIWEEAAYSCDPYIGYYEDTSDGQQGVLKGVPICQSFCDSWYEACENDFTCVDDWLNGFNYTDGYYTCPVDSTCKTFGEWYGNSTAMCTRLWGNSFVPATDENNCYSLWFWSANPNAWVVKHSGAEASSLSMLVAAVVAIAVLTMY
jgi:folate receptor